jgi:hypothetical protein
MTLVALANETTSAEIDPERGARVQHLVDLTTGRELLYQHVPPDPSSADFASATTGGWDELFPNDTPWDSHPDHGRIWSTPFAVTGREPGRASLTASLQSPRVEVERTHELLEAPRRGLRVTTTLRALEDTGFYLWASHPLLAVETGWRVDLPEVILEADQELHGRFAPGELLEPDDARRSLTAPEENEGWAEVLYAGGVSSATVVSADGSRATRVAWDSSFLRHLWIVTVTGELDIPLCIVLEPCTTRPYRLEEAIQGGEAATLTAGVSRRWWTELESLDSRAAVRSTSTRP